MASSLPLSKCSVPKTKEEEAEEERIFQNYRNLISTFPQDSSWCSTPMNQYKGFWIPQPLLEYVMAVEEHFHSRQGDIFLVSLPKVGTTWLKALAFATVNRNDHPHPLDSLLTANPHELVPFINSFYANRRIPDFDLLPSPRIFATHAPYNCLPRSVLESEDCRVVYICRNPKDTIVSFWHFMNRSLPKNKEPLALESVFRPFCEGISPYGPFSDHVLGFWKESMARPGKVLFLSYEDLQLDPRACLKRLAEFVGHPFTQDEEKEGIIEKILKLCSIENLSGLEVNKTGKFEVPGILDIKLAAMFRKGKVGDWVNHLTPEMAEQLDQTVAQRLKGSGLTFRFSV